MTRLFAALNTDTASDWRLLLWVAACAAAAIYGAVEAVGAR